MRYLPSKIPSGQSKVDRSEIHHKVIEDKQVSVVMWLAPWPPVRETRVQIPEQHGNLVKFILVWVFFNPSGILTQP